MWTWSGWVYVAFVFDAHSRRILGWRAATSMTTPLVLDCLEMALWTRRREGATGFAGLTHHTDAGSVYTSISFTDRRVLAATRRRTDAIASGRLVQASDRGSVRGVPSMSSRRRTRSGS